MRADDGGTPRWRRPVSLHREMGYVGATLFLSGALLVIVDLAVGAQPYGSERLVVLVAAAATLAGIFYAVTAERYPLPLWAFITGTTAGAVMVTVLVFAGGPERTATFGILYVFVSTYGFYYYGPVGSSWLVAVNGVGFASALVHHDVTGGVAEWFVVVGTSVVAGGLTGFLSQRVRHLLRVERETVEALSELDGWRTTFLRAAAHDLRSPLAAVKGLLQVLLARDADLSPVERRELVQRTMAASDRVLRLVEDLLDVQRIEAGVLEPALAAVSLDAVVRESVAALEADADIVEVDVEPVTAVVEPAKVDRILTNLVRNAIEHTGRDASVWVRLREARGQAVLVVEDDGPGLDGVMLHDLFEAFHRRGTGPGPGVGLGLHLVRRFADLHGGTVEAADRPGGGARFTVRLPVAGPGSPPANGGTAPTTVDADGERA